MNAQLDSRDDDVAAALQAKLDRLKAAAAAERYPSLAVRKDRLRRTVDVLLRNEKRIVAALDHDFGGRPEALNLLTDVLAPTRSLKHSLKHVEQWMKTEKRKPEFPMGLVGGTAEVFYQPLGVVGVVAPWNAPVALAFSPLASIFAAGNRAMVKPSELVPTVADLIAEMINSTFDPSEAVAVTGELEVARAFTALPFDHLVFTGGAGTARFVMKAAAEHLTPVTLELGGKSPAIIAKGCDLAYAAAKVCSGKFVNAGQVCMAPDFAMVHRSEMPAFIREVRATVQRMYPDFASNKDFTRVHLPRQRQRLTKMIEEAGARGAKVEVLNGLAVDALADAPRFPPVLVENPPLDIELMREEVFGPILPVVAYDTLQQAADTLASMSRPLALYFIGGNAAEKDFILRNTWAGGVTFDDVMLHPFMQDLAFGGVGESGMGRYLGHDGFKALSNAKGVVQRPWLDVSKYISPPYSPALVQAMRKALRF